MNATPIGTRHQIVDGKDLIVVWLDAVGFHSQRITDFNGELPIRHERTTIGYDDLVMCAEGQRKLPI